VGADWPTQHAEPKGPAAPAAGPPPWPLPVPPRNPHPAAQAAPANGSTAPFERATLAYMTQLTVEFVDPSSLQALADPRALWDAARRAMLHLTEIATPQKI
jgi:hypothetical protein